MIRFISIIILINCVSSLKAQVYGDSSVLHSAIFSSVEKGPVFPGGMKALYRFISENLEEPEIKTFRFSNRYVIADIVINEEGKVAYGKITKGLNEQYNYAVLKMIAKMPSWKPALQNNRPVKCYQTIPVVFVGEE